MPRRKREIPPIHPGEILLEEFLKPLGMSMNQLALALRVPANRIAQIVDRDRTVSPETTLRLGRFFATGPEFWLNLQMRYDLECARDSRGKENEREVQQQRGG